MTPWDTNRIKGKDRRRELGIEKETGLGRTRSWEDR
jgi:hypothetical protein